MAAGRGAPINMASVAADLSHAAVAAKANADRADLIDRLSRGRAILAGIKGHLEANKLAAARSLSRTFDASEQAMLDRVNAFLAEGLFGDGK